MASPDSDHHSSGVVATALDGGTTGVVPIIAEFVEERTAKLRPELRLVCVSGVDLGRTFQVRETALTLGLTIGRGGSDVTLHGHDISRHHARLTMRGDDYVLEDLGSVNGTYVNGAQLRGSTPLKIGDRIQIATTILVLTRHDELEARLRQLQKLEAMGALAGGLAHDFNNALTVITTGLEHLEERLARDPGEGDVQTTVSDMQRALSAACGLAKRLIHLGRTEPLAVDVVALAPLVDETIAMVQHLGCERIVISTDVGPDMRVLGAREELHQVLLNLLINARDAMPNGGKLFIGARSIRLDRSTGLATHLPGEGEYVELTVTDTGVGMDDATLARAFEPFFTTKPSGKGNGLGLTMIYNVVRRHRGSVVVESIADHGTTFRILLPT